eukprot:g56379.t1
MPHKTSGLWHQVAISYLFLSAKRKSQKIKVSRSNIQLRTPGAIIPLLVSGCMSVLLLVWTLSATATVAPHEQHNLAAELGIPVSTPVAPSHLQSGETHSNNLLNLGQIVQLRESLTARIKQFTKSAPAGEVQFAMAVASGPVIDPVLVARQRCGTTWEQANLTCGATCSELNKHHGCARKELCFGNLSMDPCLRTQQASSAAPPAYAKNRQWSPLKSKVTTLPPNGTHDVSAAKGTHNVSAADVPKARCGSSWSKADKSCGPPCPSLTEKECGTGEFCFDNLSPKPCIELFAKEGLPPVVSEKHHYKLPHWNVAKVKQWFPGHLFTTNSTPPGQPRRPTFYFRLHPKTKNEAGCPKAPDFTKEKAHGSCGDRMGNRSKYWVAIQGGSHHCDRMIQVTDVDTKKSLILIVKDSCPGCHGHVDMSLGALVELAGSYERACSGRLRTVWKFVDEKLAPV